MQSLEVRDATRAPSRPGLFDRWGPALLVACLLLVLVLPALPPSLQLYDRDTSRCESPFKAFMAERLRAGQLPLWVPWTEAGTSLLGQVTPALFHPFTALYLALPFELAFKLNHLLAFPLAALGLWLLARSLGADRWGSAAGATAYAASGWLVSMTASNLHYALSAAAAPLALWALLGLWRSPGAPRLAAAASALALTAVGGDPQWLLFFGGAAALAGVALGGGGRAVLRRWGLAAATGCCALALAAPALLPAVLRIPASSRAGGTSKFEESVFAVVPARLAGLAIPWAFDDRLEETNPREDPPAFEEYFGGQAGRGFASTLALGFPVLLLAAAAPARKRRWLLAGAGVCLAASLGSALPLEPALRLLVPGYRLFRYPEKWMAPATLALALACALGASEVGRGRAQRLARAVLGPAVLLAALALLIARPGLEPWLVRHGREHLAGPAHELVQTLRRGLLVEAGLCLLLGAVLAAGARKRWGPPALAALCGCSVLLATAGSLFVAPLAVLRAEVPLLDEMVARAGPSPGRWRIDSDPGGALAIAGFDRRLGSALYFQQTLGTQWNGAYGVESVAVYSALNDASYLQAWHVAPAAMSELFDVRFQLRTPLALYADEAAREGFQRGPFGIWLRERPSRPRAFIPACVRSLPDASALVAALAAPGFDVHAEALVEGSAAAGRDCGRREPEDAAHLTRPTPERIEVDARSGGGGLLIVAEHFDPGWTAELDGRAAPVVRVDLAAMGVRLPAGQHRVVLRFWPRGLTFGFWCVGMTVLALAGASRWAGGPRALPV